MPACFVELLFIIMFSFTTLRSDYPLSVAELARMDVTEEDFDSANILCNKILTDFSEDPALDKEVKRIIWAYWEKGEYAKVRELSLAVISSQPDNAMWARSGLIRTNIILGNDLNITEELDELISEFAFNPGLPDAILETGLAYYSKALWRAMDGDTESEKASYRNAISVWERLLQEFPDSEAVSHAYYFSARCYESIGEYEDAIRYYQKVVDDWPDEVRSPSLLYRITNLYEKLEKSALISTKDAAVQIPRACERFLADYPDSRDAKHVRKILEHWNFINAWLISQQK